MIVKPSTFKMDIESYNKLYRLFQEFCRCDNMTGDEFIEMKLISSDAMNLREAEIENFVLMVTHKNFLVAIKENFVSHYNARNYNDVRIIMVIFVILFSPDQLDAKSLFKLFKDVKCAFKNKLLRYFWTENNLIQTALTGCKFFEDEYILNRIINPLLNKSETLKKVDELLYKEKMAKRKGRPPTIPDHITMYNRRRVPPAPANTPNEPPRFHATEVPKTLYRPSDMEKRLMGEFERNRLKAQKLLAQAKALEKNYTKAKQPAVPVEVPNPQFKAKKPPKMKDKVEIKGNVTTVLREASRYVKEQELEIKNIEVMMQGGATLDTYKKLEKNVQQLEQQKSLEEIERKHLEGLLTFEEAILAKRKLVEYNKEHFKKFMEERENFLQQIEEWREHEQEKIKQQVRKTQEIERNAKESEKRLKEEKKNQADKFRDETRKLLEQAYQKQQEELAKKVKLISEIKSWHQLKSLHSTKEFDPNECANLGLLCQMSIADLQQKLIQLKLEMEEQLEQKRKCIKKYREKQRKMLEDVKNFVMQTRMSKPKPPVAPIRPAKLVHSPELDKLRTQLEHARELRKINKKLQEIPYPDLHKHRIV